MLGRGQRWLCSNVKDIPLSWIRADRVHGSRRYRTLLLSMEPLTFESSVVFDLTDSNSSLSRDKWKLDQASVNFYQSLNEWESVWCERKGDDDKIMETEMCFDWDKLETVIFRLFPSVSSSFDSRWRNYVRSTIAIYQPRNLFNRWNYSEGAGLTFHDKRDLLSPL